MTGPLASGNGFFLEVRLSANASSGSDPGPASFHLAEVVLRSTGKMPVVRDRQEPVFQRAAD